MIGKTVSHYRILSHIGSGGMGDVYLAEDSRLGRTVALKFLSDELAKDPQALKRFDREARAAAELSHPNIATIHDFGEAEGRRFLVLEYIEGQTLKERLREGPLPLEEVLSVGQALAAALTEAHSRKIVHRDVKSANVMLTPKGGVKILDFGLALKEGSTQLTATGTIVGTVDYMSPEQIRGMDADARSDIWGLGVILYECVTGKLPFRSESGVAVAHRILSEAPTPPTALRTGIPLELEQSILRCLEKQPDFRRQHAEDLLSDLRRLESGVRSTSPMPPQFVPVTNPETTRKKPVVSPKLLVSLIVAGVILSGLLVTSVLRTPVQDVDPSLAIVDFQGLSQQPEDTAVLMGLLNVGLIEGSPIRVVSRVRLLDLHRRMFDDDSESIHLTRSLALAQAAGATHLLTGGLGSNGEDRYVNWELVDTATGDVLGAGHPQSEAQTELANSIVADVVRLLGGPTAVDSGAGVRRVETLTTSSPEAYRRYISGLVASYERRVEDAINGYERAVAIDSTFALAYLALATEQMYFGSGGARDYLDRAWRHRDSLGTKEQMRLETMRSIFDGNWTDVAVRFEIILDRWPDDYDILYDVAEGYRFWRFTVEALEVAERALRIYPSDVRFLTIRANTLATLDRRSESRDAQFALIEIEGGNPNTWDNLGLLYLELSQPDSARWAFEQALDIDPAFVWSRQGLAATHYVRGDVDGAIEMLRLTLEGYELGRIERYTLLTGLYSTPGLAGYYVATGRYENALRCIDEALESIPMADRAGLRRRDLRYLWLGAEEYERLLEQCPPQDGFSREQIFVSSLRALALVRLDSLEAALPLLEELSGQISLGELSGGINQLWFFLWARAEAQLASGQPEVAIRTLEELRWPRSVFEANGLPRALARGYRLAGRPSEAERRLTEVARACAGQGILHYDLGLLYEEMRRFDAAKTAYERFLEMWSEADAGLPQVEDARARLAALRQ